MIKEFSEIGLHPAPIERFLFRCGLWIATGQHLAETPTLMNSVQLAQGDKSLIGAAFRERVVPIVSEFSRIHQMDVDPDFVTMSRVVAVGMKAIFKHVSPVVQALGQSGIDVMILKGADLSLTTYPPNLPRMMHDMDILVKPSDAIGARTVFLDHGFIQGEFDRNKLQIVPYSSEEREASEANHYELAPFRKLLRLPSLNQHAAEIEKYVSLFYGFMVRRHEVFYAVKCDIHLHVSRKFALEDTWYRPRQIQLPFGRSAFAQSPADLLWFLSARLYYQTMSTATVRMLQFIDVLSVAKTLCGEIHWPRVQDIAARYKLHASLFYVFSLVNHFIDGAVPNDVIDFCNPERAGVPKHNNLGNFASKLFRIMPGQEA